MRNPSLTKRNNHQRSSSGVYVLLLATCLLSGCAIGYNSTLFVTKSNAGLDVSSTPPTAAISIDRTEGIVTPQFEDGTVLPAMASFKTSGKNLFSPAAGSTFATGDAAVTMSGLFGEATPSGGGEARYDSLRDEYAFDSTVKLNTKPLLKPILFGLVKPTFQETSSSGTGVKPAFFGTRTSLGANLSWSGLTATLPDSLTVGYNRKELTVLPVSMSEGSGENGTIYSMNQASLLATMDSSLTSGSFSNSRASFVQFFSVGDSATLLAQQESVRKAMFISMDGPAGAAAAKLKSALNEREQKISVTVSKATKAILAVPTTAKMSDVLDGLVAKGVWGITAQDVTPIKGLPLEEQKFRLINFVSDDENLEALNEALVVLEANK